MAHNLIQSGHRLVVFDLVDSAMQDAVSAGAQRAGSPAEVRREGKDKYFYIPRFVYVLAQVFSRSIKVFITTS